MNNQPADVFFQTVGPAVHRYAARLAVAASALGASVCLAAAGDLDPNFGNKGLFYFPDVIAAQFAENSSKYDNARQVITLSRGGYLVLGGVVWSPTDSTPFRSSPSFALTSSGVIDTTFGDAGRLPGVSAMTVSGYPAAQDYKATRQFADGRLMLTSEVVNKCGSVNECRYVLPGLSTTVPAYNVQRNFPSGTLDLNYGSNGNFFVNSHWGNAAILSDGTTIALATAEAIIVDPAGHPDPAAAAKFVSQLQRCPPFFNIRGTYYGAPLVESTTNNQIVWAWGSCLLKLNRDGSPDASFGAGGLAQLDNAGLPLTRVLLLKDGGILSFALLGDGSSYRVTKQLPNGMPDGSFGVGGTIAKLDLPFVPIPEVISIFSPPVIWSNRSGLPALDAMGRVLVAGFVADNGPNQQTNYIARFDAQLRLDKTFGSMGNGLAQVGNADIGLFVPLSVAVDSLDRMVFAGYLKAPNPKTPQLFAYSSALIRMQADPPPPIPVEPSAGGSGGCGTVRDARFDPTLWVLLVTALLVTALGRRRRPGCELNR